MITITAFTLFEWLAIVGILIILILEIIIISIQNRDIDKSFHKHNVDKMTDSIKKIVHVKNKAKK